MPVKLRNLLFLTLLVLVLLSVGNRLTELESRVAKQSEMLVVKTEAINLMSQRINLLHEENKALSKEVQGFLEAWDLQVFTATAYSPYDDRNELNSEGNPNVTATGVPPGPTKVAVDFSVIPRGTRIWVQGEGWVTAADTGGAIRGNRIDVFRETFEEAISYGVKKVYVALPQ